MSIGASLAMVEITVWLNEWNKSFYDALAELQVDAIYPLLSEFCWLVVGIVLLAQVDLTHLQNDLDYQCDWQLRLSGGEQQRLSLARALLAKPDTLILDEASSHLDEGSARRMIETLKEQLPRTSLMMVSHQQGLQPLFEQQLDLNRFAVS